MEFEVEQVGEIEIDSIASVGPRGYSAYEVYLQNGGTLTESQWLASLKGDKGDKGDTGDMPDMSAYYNKTDVNTLLAGKVSTETGKGLSANDFSDTYKNKVDGIASNAQVNVIETIKVDNNALTPSSKTVNIDLSGKQNVINSSNKLSADNVDDTSATNKFVTSTEKSNIASNTTARHTHSNKTVLDNTTASYTTAEQSKLSGIESNANNYSLPTAAASTLGGVKVGDTLSISDGVLNINDSDNIEKAIRNYYAMTPDDKVYTVKFPLWETSNSCAGTKLDDNAGLSVTPATDTVREVSSYGPAWDSIDCNAYVDSNGVRHITALKGDENFVDVGKVDVFCLFRTYWQKIWTEDGYLYISRSFVKRDGYTINPLAINKDGTYNPWFLIPKYVAGDIEGKLYGSKGLIPAHLLYVGSQYNPSEEEFSDDVSYSGMITKGHARGSYYGAGLMAEYMHILTTFYLKFATRDTQSIMKGNTDNNYQYAVSSAETNVNRVILTTAQAANIDLYSCVSVGDRGSATNNDRIYAYMHNIAYDVRVIGKEVIDEGHTALILDHAKFDTTATTYVSTMHERSGFSDYIKGRTGSIGNNTNGKHGFVLDGIEIAVGGYEVVGNAFMDIANSAGKREIYFTNDSTKLTSTVATAKTTYTKSDLSINAESNASAGWKYITEFGFDTINGLAVPTKCGQSGSGSSVGYADGCYFDTSTSGQREFLWLGSLTSGATAGLSCLPANSGLSPSNWIILARLSINGVGGELTE